MWSTKESLKLQIHKEFNIVIYVAEMKVNQHVFSTKGNLEYIMIIKLKISLRNLWEGTSIDTNIVSSQEDPKTRFLIVVVVFDGVLSLYIFIYTSSSQFMTKI